MTLLRRVAILLWVAACIGVVFLGLEDIVRAPARSTPQKFPEPGSTQVIERLGGHAYQYIAAPNITWDAARAAAENMSHKGQAGYRRPITDEAEFRFVMEKLLPADNDVTLLGGRQTAPNEWRWVTGPEAAMDGGKGRLFWTGMEKGSAPDGAYANWMYTAFQHGGNWDSAQCLLRDPVLDPAEAPVQRRFSLGNGDPKGGDGISGRFGN